MPILRKVWFHLSIAVLLIAAPTPSKAQAANPSNPTTASGGKKGGKTAPASPVDLNNASQAELQSVPGIGAPTAKKSSLAVHTPP